MVICQIERYHLCMALGRVRRTGDKASELVRAGEEMLKRHVAYLPEHLQNPPEVGDWMWSD